MAANSLFITLSVSSGKRHGAPKYPIQEVLAKELNGILEKVARLQISGCLLTDIGNILVEVVDLTTKLADGLVNGAHISTNAKKTIRKMDRDTDFSELHVLDYLNKKHSMLRDMLSSLQASSTQLAIMWNDAPEAPLQQDQLVRRIVPSMENVSVFPDSTLSWTSSLPSIIPIPDSLPAPGFVTMENPAVIPHGLSSPEEEFSEDNLMEDTDTEQSDSEDEVLPSHLRRISEISRSTLLHQTLRDSDRGMPHLPTDQHSTAQIGIHNEPKVQLPPELAGVNIKPLAIRGKGHHTCPLGITCNKGGVQSNGQLVVFERNCEFRAHLQKHDKVFRCNLPGCKNTRGFARIDQLKRHQERVLHRA